jgi:hypothetical protein
MPATLKMFRVHLCQPINFTTLEGDFDWRDFVYDLRDISLEQIDLHKKYQSLSRLSRCAITQA